MKPEDYNKLVIAATFGTDAEAHIAMGMLQSNGIECVLNGEMSNDVLRMMLSPSDGEIVLLVRASDLAAARALLEANGDAADVE